MADLDAVLEEASLGDTEEVLRVAILDDAF